MWASPLIFPHLQDPSESYAALTKALLPSGLIGLVLAGLFAHTMAMTSSDANAVSAVIVRDIMPVLRGGRAFPDKQQLLFGRITTFSFLLISMVIALFASHFGGVIGMVILWYGALLGPIAVPILLGLLRPFRRSGLSAAFASCIAGALAFGSLKLSVTQPWLNSHAHVANAITVGAPLFASLFAYIMIGVIFPSRDQASAKFLEAINPN